MMAGLGGARLEEALSIGDAGPGRRLGLADAAASPSAAGRTWPSGPPRWKLTATIIGGQLAYNV